MLKKLGSKLDKFSDEKLEKIVKIINLKIAKFEANYKMSDSKKEKLVAVYEALKELIEEKLDNTSED